MTQFSRSRGPTIEILYLPGCPHHELAVALVQRALADERIAAPIQQIRVGTVAEAQHHSFYGSPTIRVNGEDVAPLPEGASPGLACRVYGMADGRLAPLPEYETVVNALRHT